MLLSKTISKFKKVYDQRYRSAWEKDPEFKATIFSVYFGKLVMFKND